MAAIPFVQHDTRERQLRGLAAMIAGALPGVLILLWLNRALYGSVFGSGYGAASSLFAVSHIDDEPDELLARDFQTQNVVPLIGLLAPFVFQRTRSGPARCCCSVSRRLCSPIYLLYSPFPEWWYLRFLIPAIVVLLVLASAVSVCICCHGRAWAA